MNAQDNSDRSVFLGPVLTFRQFVTKRPAFASLSLVLVAVAYAAAATLVGDTNSEASLQTDDKPEAALPVTTMAAQRQDFYLRPRRYTGIVREARRSQLAFQRPGEVVELLVDEGDGVEQGQLVARLDTRHILARQAQLEAEQAEAQAVLDELLAGPRAETIAATRAELRARQAERDSLKKQVARRERLVASASVSREEYNTLVHDLAAAEARLDVVGRQLDELLAGTRREQIAAGRARHAQLEASLTDVAHDLDDAALTAPFAGRVARRFVDEGVVLSAGTAVFELIEDASLEARVGLPPRIASTVAVGDVFSLEADGQMVEAAIRALSPDVAAETRTRDVIFRIATQHAGRLAPGQVVRLVLEERIDQPGFWIPTTALTQAPRGLWALHVVEPSGPDEFVVARREVELMDTDGNRSFIRGGLQTGEQIVVSGAHRVVVGQRVQPAQVHVATHDEN